MGIFYDNYAGVGTGPCGGRRCGTLVRGMLGEPVINCNECGWPILAGASPRQGQGDRGQIFC
jgi:DNA-directed RNA polymerase subunit RPC12/RpoP